MSNLFSASSISVLLLNSFFRYFSENGSQVVNGSYFVPRILTCSALLDFFRCNSNNVKDFGHYFRDRIHHFLTQCRLSVNLQSLEIGFQALEGLEKGVLACADILSCLRCDHITMGVTNMLEKIPTRRRTPTAVKMAFAGGNACQISMRTWISGQVHELKHTRVTPSPKVSENA